MILANNVICSFGKHIVHNFMHMTDTYTAAKGVHNVTACFTIHKLLLMFFFHGIAGCSLSVCRLAS